MTAQTLDRARAGDEDAFRELTDPYRRELQLHVYRIVGSAQDAEDLLQETLLAAWRGLERFEERASVRAWLYRIATNRSLDALRASRRRPEEAQRLTEVPEPTRRAEPHPCFGYLHFARPHSPPNSLILPFRGEELDGSASR